MITDRLTDRLTETRFKIRGPFVGHNPEKIIVPLDQGFLIPFLARESGIRLSFQKNITLSMVFCL